MAKKSRCIHFCSKDGFDATNYNANQNTGMWNEFRCGADSCSLPSIAIAACNWVAGAAQRAVMHSSGFPEQKLSTSGLHSATPLGPTYWVARRQLQQDDSTDTDVTE